jgi:hypothetical protein
MSTNDGIIALKIDQLTTMQQEANERLDDIDERLLDPRDGLYKHVRDVRDLSTTTAAETKHIKSELDKLVDVCKNHENRAVSVERWIGDHERRDEELRTHVEKITTAFEPVAKDFDRRMGIKKWTDKVIWAILSVLIVGMMSLAGRTLMRTEPSDDDIKDLLELLKDERSKRRRGSERTQDASLDARAVPDTMR